MSGKACRSVLQGPRNSDLDRITSHIDGVNHGAWNERMDLEVREVMRSARPSDNLSKSFQPSHNQN